ncbi:MAG: hypothetical protein SGJ17_03355 [Hyphomicrobiales bacterium]|nr:hypothetical protein [Hyphomicrobiales bacterium]
MKTILAAAAVMTMLAAPAFAAPDCTKRMGKLDEAIKTATVKPEDMKKVQDIRVKGDELMKAGKQDECKIAVKEALVILGVSKAK